MATALADADESILITPAELHVIFKSPIDHENRVVCIAAGRNAASASFESCHLPNSVFFNLDEIRDTTSRYPVMLPTCQVFTAAMKRLGIRATRGDTFIVYDTVEAGGHLLRSPSGLDIGTLWAQKRTGTQQLSAPDDATPMYRVADAARTIAFEELRHCVLDGCRQYQILDSRSEDCFLGKAVGDGHIPGALSVPVACLVDSCKNLLPRPEMRAALEDAGVDENKPAVLSCNTGVTASILWLALKVAGYDVKARLYDGSWSEWKDRAEEQGLIVCHRDLL
ncbi:thiosulfate sulfurtransferase, putative [Cordyceps militaris CM01]|uniref:Sulfurtransferase n=1 Tax=Cordyceps militaris (strain CM01) TaxID=983644 RepID=G3JDV3_CORMM|nr:thiosulfate sulfurtransferase, putative [Cordyceps militaris CM01]EGX92778.1 thiosulfate sulfurtransferase, putative [Cordyceps militaris CM01]